MNYAQQLIANGMSPEKAAIEAQVNDWLRLENRDSEAYGRRYEHDEAMDGRYPSTDDFMA